MAAGNTQNITIQYRTNALVDVQEIVDLYGSTTIKRPTDDTVRMSKMVANANLNVSAWNHDRLVGFARCMSDFVYITYVADLVVHKNYQRQGIGKRMIQEVLKEAGDKASLILTSAPEAEEYYPRLGFIHHSQAWYLPSNEKLPRWRSKISAETENKIVSLRSISHLGN